MEDKKAAERGGISGRASAGLVVLGAVIALAAAAFGGASEWSMHAAGVSVLCSLAGLTLFALFVSKSGPDYLTSMGVIGAALTWEVVAVLRLFNVAASPDDARPVFMLTLACLASLWMLARFSLLSLLRWRRQAREEDGVLIRGRRLLRADGRRKEWLWIAAPWAVGLSQLLTDLFGLSAAAGFVLAAVLLACCFGAAFLFALSAFRDVLYPKPRAGVEPRKLSELLAEPEGTRVWVRPDALFTTKGEGAAVYLDGDAVGTLFPSLPAVVSSAPFIRGFMPSGAYSFCLVREGDGFAVQVGEGGAGMELSVVADDAMPARAIAVTNLAAVGEEFEVCTSCGVRHEKGAEGAHG